MLKLTIGDRIYHIEFRHVTKNGRRRQLHDRAPIQGVTTCAIAAFDTGAHPVEVQDLEFIAIDNSICALDDNFSRREGRKNALRKVLRHCGALKAVKDELWGKYMEADPRADNRPKRKDRVDWGIEVREYYITLETIDGDVKERVDRPARQRTIAPLTAEQLKAAGQEGKQERRAARKQAKRKAAAS